MHRCKGGCDLDPYEMITPIPEGEAVAKKQSHKHKYYVTPQPEQWPRYDASAKKFVHFPSGAEPDDYASMPSMLGLTKEEALSLSMVTILVDSSSHSGKYAETNKGHAQSPQEQSCARCIFVPNAFDKTGLLKNVTRHH